MSDNTQADVASLTFEKALAELEAIVRRLETGDVALEESLEIYERGAALKSHCERKLADAQLKVDKIVQSDKGGVSAEPLDTD